jgi:hypothetical protein
MMKLVKRSISENNKGSFLKQFPRSVSTGTLRFGFLIDLSEAKNADFIGRSESRERVFYGGM